MAFDTRNRVLNGNAAQAAAIDEGLRAYMLRVYNYMASAVALSGLVALLIASNNALMQVLFATPLKWVLLFAPLGVVFFLSARIRTMAPSTAQTLFWVYAGLVGAGLAPIFLIYTGESIARVFFISAASFAALSLFGYTTRKDLSGWGSFLFMGVVGILIAGIVNIFLGSAMLSFVISAAGVLIFAGLTAYDTQQIKEMYFEADDAATATKKAVFGALRLYIDFIGLFVYLLQFLGVARSE